MSLTRRATGPGRVNLIGDHTDYNQGLALPIAIGLGVTVEFTPTDQPPLSVTSTAFGPTISLPLDLRADTALSRLEPPWARLIGAVFAMARPGTGGDLRIDATLPIGSGLSSSAAVAVAMAEVFGVAGSAADIARLCQEAERRSGVPVGAMDPLVCAGGRKGHALLMDFSGRAGPSTSMVAVPAEASIVVIDSGQRRTVRTSGYAARVAECEAAASIIGPLGLAHEDDLVVVHDPVLRRRARHVITECRRVRQYVEAFAAGDLVAAGALMTESHRSLADEFAVSTPALDRLVDRVVSRPGVFGARLTGAGFGGCVVALSRPGALDVEAFGTSAWTVFPSDGTVASRP